VKLHPESAKMFVVDEAAEKAKAAALNLLSRRAYTRREILEKLTEREFDASGIQSALADLERLSLVDDRQFARRFAEERIRLRPCGRRLLAQDLKRRGVPVAIVDEVLEDSFEQLDSIDMAYNLLKSRIGRYRGLDRDKAISRMYGFLGRRGFEGATAREAAMRVWREMQE
jgi:regulatory protein